MKKLFVSLLCIPLISFAQTRMPLVEYFTNTGCTNCPAYTQALDQALKNVGRSNVAVILYHNANPDPSDPFYLDDIQAPTDRSSYYNVQADPDGFIDAISAPGNEIQNGLQHEMQQSAPLTIALSGTRTGRSGNLNVSVTGNVPASWKLFAIITETGLTYHGTNGEVTHNDVFRSVLTTWSGVDASSGNVQLPFTLGTGHDSDNGPTDTTPWNIDSCRIVVWAQNVSTKAIYQAAQIWVDSLTQQNNNAFTFTTDDTLLSALPETGDNIAVGYINNTSASPLNISGVRLSNNLPTGWTTAICLNYCGASTVDTVPGSVNAHSRKQFLLHFDPNSIPGTANVMIKFYDDNNPGDSIVKQFFFKTNDPFHFTYPTVKTISATGPDTIRWSGDSEAIGSALLDYSTDDSDWYFIDTVSYGFGGGSYIWNPGFQSAVYNVRLRLDMNGEHIPSPLFNLQPDAVSEPLPVSYTLSCAPNPANTLVNISLQGYAIRRIALFDALGRLVYDAYINEPSPDMNIPINTSALLPGVYYARVFTSSKVLGAPVIVVH
ncbi:MAG TPA: Omp28-related outer membrane protein [Candidatus Kapabacteria bacterium]|nr:Omp28-related outer membrane protein [Candidatus Kapabacteria bacterium]